ncbi:MAG: sensor histidine kinase [Aquincola tertiaricarbonis]|uniref:sensor histidine kinase n=1 Tax=Aquincola sp. J276 TaxID=2898432 RepID=UPI0021515C40|nr:ATP-binding protein [Aquincola sp. J276]MCR5866135.1 PAS domain S-box protein [Aquincola sp. J276]
MNAPPDPAAAVRGRLAGRRPGLAEIDITTVPSTTVLAEAELPDTAMDPRVLVDTQPPALPPPRLAGGALAALGFTALAALMAGLTWAALAAPVPAHLRMLLWAALALGWLAAALALHRLVARLASAVAAVQRFAERLRHDDLPGAILALRAHSLRGSSALHAAAGEVQLLLGERERRWHARVRLSGDWYWETDAQHRICWVSDDLSSHLKLGLEPRQLLGHTYDSVPFFQPPEAGWSELMLCMHQRRDFRDVEIEVRRPGRSPVWIGLTGRPRRNDDGQFIGHEGVGRDITEQRLAFRRLHDSERRYAVMNELSADWYWETDAEHRFVVVGDMLTDLLGDVGARRFIGRTRWHAYADGASEEEWQRHRRQLEERRPFSNFEYAVRVPGRGVRWVSVSGQPRHDAHGRFLGFHGVGRDVTLRKRTEKMLLSRNAELARQVAERTAELEQHNRDLEAFSRQLAHELRTPIGHVVGLADMLRARAWERLADDERHWLTLQGRAARDMSHTVTALLELARSGSAPLVREPVDLSALARSVITELPWVERAVPVEWQIQPGLVAHCSAPLVRVALANLLGNAAKFTRDVPLPLVRLAASGEPGVFVVQDNGAGFDARRAARLFQPFQRLHTAEQFHGTGLGLSIVRRIVERHGGTVRAEAPAKGGASFYFSLGGPLQGTDNAGESTDAVAPRPT